MTEITEIAEKSLLQRQLLPEKFGPASVRPSYDGLGLVNIAALATEWLAPTAPALSDQAALPAFRPGLLDAPEVSVAWQTWQAAGPINHVVLLLLDALGYDQLRTVIAEGGAPNLAKATASQQAFFVPATSVYPSTTTTALTTAATAYAPAQHGIMGTNVYLREIGSMVNLIGYRPSIAPTNTPYQSVQLNPDKLVPVPNLYQRLEQAGIRCEVVNHYLFKDSSISRFTSAASQAGREFYSSYQTPVDGFSQLRRRLEVNSVENRPSFTYIYVPNVDSAAHQYGPLSPSYRAEVAALDFGLGHELFEPLSGRSDIVLLLVADHGQRYRTSNIAWLNQHPALTRMLQVPMSGENRAPYLHLKHGLEAAAIKYINQNLEEGFLVVPKAEAIELGLFGLPGQPLGPECDDRIGDLLLVPKNDWVCRQQLTEEEPGLGMIGVHGGLSRAEMLIPFLAYRF